MQNISITVKKGEAVGVLGRNGSGKSTLLSIASATLTSFDGDVLYDGVKIKEKAFNKEKTIGYVPQDDFLFGDLSVADNIKFWQAAYKVKGDFSNILYELGLIDLKKQKVGKLSGGMKRRLMIAVSILHNPGYILMDEPNTGLDYYYKDALHGHLKKMKNENKAVLYAGHDVDDIARLCDDVVILNNGKLEENTTDDVYIKVKNIRKSL